LISSTFPPRATAACALADLIGYKPSVAELKNAKRNQ
jgi:hypothetical protein